MHWKYCLWKHSSSLVICVCVAVFIIRSALSCDLSLLISNIHTITEHFIRFQRLCLSFPSPENKYRRSFPNAGGGFDIGAKARSGLAPSLAPRYSAHRMPSPSSIEQHRRTLCDIRAIPVRSCEPSTRYATPELTISRRRKYGRPRAARNAAHAQIYSKRPPRKKANGRVGIPFSSPNPRIAAIHIKCQVH